MSNPEIPTYCKMFFEVKGDPHGRDGCACVDSVLLAAIKAERRAKQNKEAWAVWGGLPL
jgi:hypothetical protein